MHQRNRNNEKNLGYALLRAAILIPTMLGFSGLVMPHRAEAAPSFVADVAGNPLAAVDAIEPYPTFADIDGDGDLDAFIGHVVCVDRDCRGRVNFYRNAGTPTAPNFVLDAVDNPLAVVDLDRTAVPEFADIDGDGDLDAFVAGEDGTVSYYRNIGDKTTPNFVERPLSNPLANHDVGRFAVPSIVDIDGDGDLDVFLGNWDGQVKFRRNTGDSINPGFFAVPGVDPLAGVQVLNGARPSLADIDGDGDLDAFITATGYGWVKTYRNTGSKVAPHFVDAAEENPLSGVNVTDAQLGFADIDGDGDLDAFVGGADDTVKFYRNTDIKPAPVFVADEPRNPLASFDVGNFATPTFADIDGDGDLDAFVGEDTGIINLFLNTGTSVAPTFVELGPVIVASPYATPTFVDIEGDGDLDAVIGDATGAVRFYRNTGTQVEGNFVERPVLSPLAGFDVGALSSPTFTDIDGDGDLDAFFGEANGTVMFLGNLGSQVSPVFSPAVINPLAAFDLGLNAMPAFADLDGDGDLDAFIGESLGTSKYLRNTGTRNAPSFESGSGSNPLAGFDVGERAAPTFADLDGDGDLDAFIGDQFGEVSYYRNVATAPTASNNSVVVLEDGSYYFTPSDFSDGYDDVHDDPMVSIRITRLVTPSLGSLRLDGVDVTLDQVIELAEIEDSLSYRPANNNNGILYDYFRFTVSDGIDESTSPNTIIINVTPRNDPPTGTVTITGSAIEDEILTANNSLADVDGLGEFHYQWNRNNSPIPGADQGSYKLGDADVGKLISVTISYVDDEDFSNEVTSPPTVPVANVNDPPTGTVTISGIVREDQTLSAANTLSDDDGLGTIFYQWRRNGENIAGATKRTYRLGDQDVYKFISVVISYTDGNQTPESKTSDETAPVVNVNDQPDFWRGPDVTVPVNSSAQTIFGWVEYLRPGPFHERDQNVEFVFELSDFTGNLRFDSSPAIDPVSGDLTFAAATGTSGTVTASVVLMDDGGTENGGIDSSAPEEFRITVGINNADLQIVKSNNAESVQPGSRVVWDIVINNLGSVDATGVLVQDSIPDEITNPSWDCFYVGILSRCDSDGRTQFGDVSDVVDVQAGIGRGVLIRVSGTLAADASGVLSNTATLSLPSTISDSDLNNNTSTDTDQIISTDTIFTDGFEGGDQ